MLPDSVGGVTGGVGVGVAGGEVASFHDAYSWLPSPNTCRVIEAASRWMPSGWYIDEVENSAVGVAPLVEVA